MKQSYFKQPKHINHDRLHEEMKAALGEKYESMDTGVKLTREDTELKIIVRVSDDATEADTATVEKVLADHNPELLSSEQQRVKDRADAYERVKNADFAALRRKQKAEKDDAVIDLLEDIQRIMRGVD
jgi:hypothetical protein